MDCAKNCNYLLQTLAVILGICHQWPASRCQEVGASLFKVRLSLQMDFTFCNI